MGKQIAIYGALDRFNYGDLLFGVVLEKVFEQYKDYNITYYALRKSDLSRFEGRPTQGIKSLFRKGNLEDGSIVIISGGEVLGASWFLLHRYLLSNYLGFFLKVFDKIFSDKILNNLSRLWFKSKLTLPFVVSPEDFPSNLYIAYNSVGGTSLKKVSEAHLKTALKKLQKSTFISVRDQESLNILQNNNYSLNVRLSPDSAALMPDLFSKKRLLKLISKETEDIINGFKNGYLCFQSADYLAKDNIKIIVEQLEKISLECNLGILLLPIGRASGHEDQVVLAKIHKKLSVASVLPSKNSIYDIMALIAYAKVFAGTSLHGNITAMSFCVPNIGLTNKVTKLTAYLKTWALPQLNRCEPYEKLTLAVQKALEVKSESLFTKRDQLLSASWEGMNKMKQALGLEEL